MRMYSTKIRTIFSLALAFCAVQLSAQTFNTMTIDSPASIAGDYTVVSAGFGLEPTDPVVGSLALGVDDTAPENDACTALVNNLDGLIGMIDRGSCNFDVKVKNTENAGAIAVLVCNSAPGPAEAMGAGDPPDIANSIGVYAAMASQSDCNTIKAELQNGAVDITFSYKAPPCSAEYDSTVVWGANGEGEFDQGLGDWVSVGTAAESDVFTWSEFGLNQGALATEQFMINSPTICNGAMIMDYDFLSTGGTQEGLDNNTWPYLTHSGQLISPSIDLSAADFPVVEFYQHQLPLNGSASFAYSIDDGTTWTEESPITTENVFTASITNLVGTEFMTINMPEAANQANVRMRFTSTGNDYYFWMIDDVLVRSERVVDVRANGNFYAVYNNFQTPASQVDAMPFLIDVENIGNIDVTGVRVDATITNTDTGEEVHSQSLDYGTIAAGFLDENKVFGELFTPPAEVANYTGAYTVVSDNDENAENDVQSFNFEITENRFAKVQSEADAGGEYLGNRAAPNEYYQSYGNYYYIPNGAGLSVDEVSFGVVVDDLANSSGFITLTMYQWNDANTDGQCTSDERIELAREEILVSEDVTAAELRNMTFNLKSPGGGPINLTDDGHYLIMANMRPLLNTGSQYRIVAANTEINPNYAYSAMNLALAQDFSIGRYGSFSGTGADNTPTDIDNRPFSFNPFWSVAMPLTIGVYSDVNDLNNDLDVKVFPNPATDKLIVDLILENNSETVSFNLSSLDGKVLLNQKAYNVQYNQIDIDITEIPSGIYMLNVITEDGYTNKKVVVSK